MSTPLATVGSIKVKLGALVTASVVVAMVVSVVGYDSGVPLLVAVPVTLALALGVTQLLAVGMTSPLREMTEATRRMARGDYRGRVHAESADEVGELARAFNQMAAELATVDREQRDLVATVSHELRTPLAGLTAVLENLADGVVPTDEAHLDAAVEQARRLSALVTDLLDLSRVDAGIAALALEERRRRGAARRDRGGPGADRPRRLLRGRGRRRVSSSGPTGPGCGSWSPTSSTTPSGTAPSAARSGSTPPSRGDRWHLEVADDGPGVAPADRERAFERFGTLGSDPGAAGGGGTGLGLAIARWVAGLHGGTVRFVDPPTRHDGGGGARRPAARPAAAAGRRTDRWSRPLPTCPLPARSPSTYLPSPTRWPGASGPTCPGPGVRVVLADGRRGRAGRAAGARTATSASPSSSSCVAAGGTVWWAAQHRRDPFTLTCLVLAALCTLPVVLLDAEWIVGPVPGRGHREPARRGDARAPPGRVRGGGSRLAARRPARPAVAEPQPARRAGPRARPEGAADGRLVGARGAGLRAALRVRRRGRRRLAGRPGARPDASPAFVQRCFTGVFIGGATLAMAYVALNPPDVSAVPGR